MHWLRVAAVNGFLAVAAGAFGAHALKERLMPDKLAVFETAARYHMYHALALLGVALLAGQASIRTADAPGWCFTIGIVLFSGSLYGYSLGGPRFLAMITPVGGVAFLLGWAMLLLAAAKMQRS